MSALVIALHGTRRPEGLDFAEALTAAVASRLPGVRVEPAWVDIHDVLLPQTLAGVGDAVVVPAFLTAGYHVGTDVPDAIASVARRRSRVVATEHVGPLLGDAVHDRLLQTGPLPDAVVLAAAGSRRTSALDEVDAAARDLERRIRRPVRVGYLYAASPTVAEAVDRLRERGHRDLAVATYALAPGLYQQRLDSLPVRAVAEPIGVHPALVDAILARYLSATGLRRAA